MSDGYKLDYGVPDYKIVTISGVTARLILDDDFSIKVSSKYGPLWEASPNNLTTLLSNSWGLPSGQFALQGAQIWQGTDPLTVSITCSLYMDTDPYNDVVAPVKALMSTVLPTIQTEFKGVLGTVEKLIEDTLNVKLDTLIPPGPNIQALAQMVAKDSSKLKGIFSSSGAKGVHNVTIGFVTLNNCVITSAEPTFSKEVSKSSNGKYYPISASVSLEISTIEIATTDMLKNMF